MPERPMLSFSDILSIDAGIGSVWGAMMVRFQIFVAQLTPELIVATAERNKRNSHWQSRQMNSTVAGNQRKNT